MKRTFLFILAAICVATNYSFATKLTITAQNYSFSPGGASIHLGDTVVFSWVNGSHTTTSTVIPSGASSWNAPLDSSNTSFTYIPAVTGTYNFKCTPHASMGMIDSFIVLPPSGVSSVNNPPLFTVSPNPATTTLLLHVAQAAQPTTIILSDISGRVVMKNVISGQTEIKLDVSAIPNGMYIIKAEQNATVFSQKITVAH